MIEQNFKLPTYSTQIYLPLLSMAYVIFILTGFLFVKKEIQIPDIGIVSTGAFVLPMSFVVIDIIAEVYGYTKAKQVIISGIIAQGLFCLLCYILLHVHSSITSTELTNQSDYQKIVGELPRIYAATAFSLIVSGFINTYLLTKWQFMCRGKYFWLRSIGGSTIGEGIFTLIAIVLIGVGSYSKEIIFQNFVLSYLSKIITTIIFAYPANFIRILLQKYENFSATQDTSKIDHSQLSMKGIEHEK